MKFLNSVVQFVAKESGSQKISVTTYLLTGDDDLNFVKNLESIPGVTYDPIEKTVTVIRFI